MSTTCAAVVTLELGVDYLVFRDRSGALLAPGLNRKYRPSRPPQRPVIERLSGSNDPWLSAVERAISERDPQAQ
ncbi:MAG: hypothetical protein JNJ73_08525 [Hyphomonadaceae bacterium]|nr:hypothetical protein [Hyphomonadaceae bacterium]